MKDPYQRYSIWIDKNFSENLSEISPAFLNEQPAILRTAGTPWTYLEQYFQNIYSEYTENRPGWNICIIGSALQLLVHMNRAWQNIRSIAPLAEKRELLDDIISYVETHLDQKITLDSTAAHFNFMVILIGFACYSEDQILQTSSFLHAHHLEYIMPDKKVQASIFYPSISLRQGLKQILSGIQTDFHGYVYSLFLFS